eukprot:TRINITY_DN19455_c0_g1_i1.p1 TRINITY_DN19455_c0_g1~~TRINITY_DN19455_c0_g1_i1.p1  ORF type:complete len:981 (-),score=386.73 TRINITY_DN19455_c0_g1_i1:40-2982(-)
MSTPQDKLSLEKEVTKATSSKATAPKRKHVRNCIIETWGENGGSLFLTELFRRPLESNEVVCWKGLITLHQVMLEGHPKVLEDVYYRLSFLDAIGTSWGRHNTSLSGKGLFELNNAYSLYIFEKINFHHMEPEFDGDFNVEKFEKRPKLVGDKALQALNHILDLQQAIYKVQNVLFNQALPLPEMKASVLIPIIIESYNMYKIAVILIRSLVNSVDNMDVLSFIIERFYSQYLTLRTLYSEANNIKFVTSIIAVPLLPKDPPEFTFPVKKEKKPVPKEEPKPEPPKPVEPPKPQPPQLNLFALPSNPTPAPAPVNPFAIDNSQFQPRPNPFAPITHKQNSWVTFGDALPPKQPLATPPPQISPRPAGDFSDLLTMVKEMKPTPEQTKKKEEEERKKKQEEEERERRLEEQRKRAEDERRRKMEEERKRREEDEKRKREEDRKRQEEAENARKLQEKQKREAEHNAREAQRLAAEQERIRKIVQEEKSKEISDLKVKVVELEGQLAREMEKSRESAKDVGDLNARIAELEKLLAIEREKVRQLEAALAKANEDNQMLRDQMTAARAWADQEKQQLRDEMTALLTEQSKEHERLFAQLLSEVNDAGNSFGEPRFLGNENATAESVSAACLALGSTVRDFQTSTISGKKIAATVASLARSLPIFCEESKGFSRHITDADSRQKLMEAAQSVASAVSSLVRKSIDFRRLPENERDPNLLSPPVGDCATQLNIVASAAKDWEAKAASMVQDGDDLEALAEKELLAAAKTIEDAAQSLLLAKQGPKPGLNDRQLNVADAILDAAMAITKAIQMLMNAAATAQRERVEKGLANPTHKLYKRDPTWAQGLVSAAKAVAHATTQLIDTANKAVTGVVEGEAVIAASKGVAASTAQLVAACRAKADDINSPSQLKLNAAAKAVTQATTQLVAAAKTTFQEEEETLSGVGAVGGFQHKVKEMEIQTDILKLEKELENARNRLANLRKGQYQ